MSNRASRAVVLSVLSIVALVFAIPAAGAETSLAERVGVRRGVCAVLGDTRCEQALALARGGGLTVYVQLADPADVNAAAAAAEAAGLLGTRIYVARGPASRIALADCLADAVIVPAAMAAEARAEVMRVLRPGGKAILGGEEVVKPAVDGADEWTHPYHGPDNNPQSTDRIARAPYLTQFVAEPRYSPAPQQCVVAGGRMFMALGHVAWHQREEPWLNCLVALNSYNGTMLWKRPLPVGLMVDRNTMVASAAGLYLADGETVRLLDGATGEPAGEIAAPADLPGGRVWKWLALEGGVLYGLLGPAEKLDDEARWRSRNHGWPWDAMSRGYNDPEYVYGFGSTMLAYDLAGKKVLWQHAEPAGAEPIDSRSLCMKAGRIFLASFGKYVTCLDAATGKQAWRKTPADDQALFQAMGSFSKGHGYQTGWKSTIYARCTDKAVYFMGPQLSKLSSLAAEDGRLLWDIPAKINVHVVLRDDGLYTIGAQGTKGETRKLDPLTGKVLATYPVSRRACTRSTGSPDGILFRAEEGTCRLDLATGKPQWISPMRPSCNVGVLIAGGRLYWLPWVCDCNLQTFGAVACGPAGDFDFTRQATDAERLEVAVEGGGGKGPKDGKDTKDAGKSPAKEPGKLADFKVSPGDWPTYLGGNNRTPAITWQRAAPEAVRVMWSIKPTSAFEPTAPVLAGGAVFLSGSDGVVRALDAGSGQVRWKAYTGGAVHFPPTIDGGRAFVSSADGWAYAFEAATGRLLWRFRAAPAERRICVFGAIQSNWPAASGVLVDGGVAYFAAGMADYDGTYVYAVDAASGHLRWQNNTSGNLDEFSHRGVAVQGDLLAEGGKLYLAGGNSVSPGVYDMKTGKCESQPPTGTGAHAPRGSELRLGRGGVEVAGQPLYSDPAYPVFDWSTRQPPQVVSTRTAELLLLPGKAPQGQEGRTWRLVALDPYENAEMWSQPLPAEPVRWGLAVDGAARIAVTCRDGQVLCLGRAPTPPPPAKVAATK